jgi:urease accessory protein
MKQGSRVFALLVAALLLPSMAFAHVGVGDGGGLFHGIAHPFLGLDHLSAMLAVGLWAAQRGGRATWAVPLSFLGVMAFAGAIGMLGVPVPFVETGIVVSGLVLGVLIAASVQLPLAASVFIVGLFAMFHGHAHGAEMPVAFSGFSYAAGFLIATASLHACGIALGIAIQKLATPTLVRFAGVAIALSGGFLLMS